MKLPTMTQLAKETARFVKYQDGNLWYRITWQEKLDGVEIETYPPQPVYKSHDFDFPIPVESAGGGEFLPEDKGIRFMRWTRQHLEYLNAAKNDAPTKDS